MTAKTGQIAIQEIERKQQDFVDASMQIWEHPEPANAEYLACDLHVKLLKDAGFDVEVGIGGLATAIRATWGSGHPVIGFLGEYDALPMLSQKVQTTQEELVPGGWGQGCGHNQLGIGHLAACVGLKKEMEERGLPGTVVYYGCPAEEKLLGKCVMARAGAFKELDLCIAYHPNRVTRVKLAPFTGVNMVRYHFTGKTAHAGTDPYNGRSALDAVELMNVGVNYLREHVTSDVRMHYMTEVSGAPNIVPDKASVLYTIRALTRKGVEDAYERVNDCARGAALMTGTKVRIEFLSGCYPTNANKVFCMVMDEALREVGWDIWTEEEKEFAKKLDETIPEQYKNACKGYGVKEGIHLLDYVLPPDEQPTLGSTDVGDVSYIVPTAIFNAAGCCIGASGHSWHMTACSGHSIGMKGMLQSAKAMALCALKAIENPQIVEDAKKEFAESTKDSPYICPLPDDFVVPFIPRPEEK